MLDFLRSVLPVRGNYVAHTLTQKDDGTGAWPKNHHADTVETLATLAEALDKNPKTTVFYALGSFTDNIESTGKVRRLGEQATKFKTFAFDVDPKDAKQNVLYASQRAMAETTMKACATIGIPEPVFVSSGNGLHCYYPLTVELPKDMWVRISALLRDALLKTGMHLDVSKVCDPTMVLRPVGTHNKKNSGVKQVRLLSKLKTYDPMMLAEALKKYVGKVNSAKSTVKPTKKSAVMDALLSNDFPPADAELIASKCYQISVVAQSGGQVDYPFWWRALGVAKHCVDGRAVAHLWSNQDSRYTPAGTDEAFDAWSTGPTKCAELERHGGKAGCANCPHRGKISSPVQLGVAEVGEAVVVASGATIRPPKPYKIIKGKLFKEVDGENFFVSDYLLYPTIRYKDEVTGKSMALVDVNLPSEGWNTFELPMDVLAKTSEFQLWTANHQVFVHNENILGEMRRYMLTYLQELQQEIRSSTMHSTFGWEDDECTKFVLGNKMIERDQTTDIRLANTATHYEKAFCPKGDLEKWCESTKLFNDPSLRHHGLVFLMAMGSPLMVGSGLNSVLVNMYANDSGTGKSTTGIMGVSVYGRPEELSLNVKDTSNSVFKSMGVYGNLPVYMDEITEIEETVLTNTVSYITQGREKKRMNKEGGFQESAVWKSITTSSSNKDMYALLGHTKAAFDGEAMRLLQFTFDENPIFKDAEFGRTIALFLQRNYGLAGEPFVRGILQAGGPFKIYEKAYKQFGEKYGFAFLGKERFWHCAMVIAYATGKLATALGLIRFDYDACIRKGLETIKSLRAEIDGTKIDCFDILGAYLMEHVSKVCVWKHNQSSRNAGSVEAPYPNECVARVEITSSNAASFVSGKLFLNQVHFNSWCHHRGYDRKGVLGKLLGAGVPVHKDRRIALMRGTTKPLPACRVYEIEMTHPRFMTIMSQDDLGILPPSHLKLVVKEAITGTDNTTH